jgi:putative flippase GtrA
MDRTGRGKRAAMQTPVRKSPLQRLGTAARDRAFLTKAVSFGLIGVVNTVVDFGLFSLAHLYLDWPIIAANVFSWTIAVTGSYVMNSLITFAAESDRKLTARTYGRFLLAQASGLIANTATVVLASYVMPVLAGKALAIGVSFLVNFSLSHFVVFRPRSSTQAK